MLTFFVYYFGGAADIEIKKLIHLSVQKDCGITPFIFGEYFYQFIINGKADWMMEIINGF